jgi:hypothetical protein
VKPQVDNPAYWHSRSEQARLIASRISDPVARDTMLQLATSYEYLARKTEGRLNSASGENDLSE